MMTSRSSCPAGDAGNKSTPDDRRVAERMCELAIQLSKGDTEEFLALAHATNKTVRILSDGTMVVQSPSFSGSVGARMSPIDTLPAMVLALWGAMGMTMPASGMALKLVNAHVRAEKRQSRCKNAG